jgi:hypothetical protein
MHTLRIEFHNESLYKTEDSWIVGDQFFEQYYSIFDFDEKRIGFIASDPDAGEINVESAFELILLFSVCILIATGCCCCCCCFCKCCKKNETIFWRTKSFKKNALR